LRWRCGRRPGTLRPRSRPSRPIRPPPPRPQRPPPTPRATSRKRAPPPPARDLNGGVSADRAAIQFDLAWIGAYNGLITGEANDKTTAAIKTFQKDHRFKETGMLAQPERAQLSALSKEKQADDKVTGAQIGLPGKQVPNTGAGKSGTRWFSARGQIQIETFRIRGPGTTLADVGQPAATRLLHPVRHAGAEEILCAGGNPGRRGARHDDSL
jgi:peptidoglycan hydrolase-like protein with peptidoglycan-binding domain